MSYMYSQALKGGSEYPSSMDYVVQRKHAPNYSGRKFAKFCVRSGGGHLYIEQTDANQERIASMKNGTMYELVEENVSLPANMNPDS